MQKVPLRQQKGSKRSAKASQEGQTSSKWSPRAPKGCQMEPKRVPKRCQNEPPEGTPRVIFYGKANFLKIDACLERNRCFRNLSWQGTGSALSFERVSKHGETSVSNFSKHVKQLSGVLPHDSQTSFSKHCLFTSSGRRPRLAARPWPRFRM